MGQSPFLFGGLFGQDVAFERVLAFDFARPGQLEPLFGGGVGFYFRHCSNGLNVYTDGRSFTYPVGKLSNRHGKKGCKARKTALQILTVPVKAWLFFLWFGRKHQDHALAFQPGHFIHFAVILQ